MLTQEKKAHLTVLMQSRKTKELKKRLISIGQVVVLIMMNMSMENMI